MGTYKGLAVMKYPIPRESWIPDSKEAGEWGDLTFGGWIV